MGKTLPAQEVYHALEAYFRPHECTDMFEKIGLQCHNTDVIERVYTATFVSDEVLDALKRQNAKRCMLFTHHPAPQREDLNGPPPKMPAWYFDFFKENAITLFSYHIPLDRNSDYSPGNNLAKGIRALPYGEFYRHNGVLMGVLCDSPYQTLLALQGALAAFLGHNIAAYPYGGEQLSQGRLAIMAGGAANPDIYAELKGCGINAFITGVSSPSVPWVAKNHEQAKAHGVSILGGTHYSTEKVAAIAMTRFFEGLGLSSAFIPETPNLSEL